MGVRLWLSIAFMGDEEEEGEADDGRMLQKMKKTLEEEDD